MPSGYTNKIKDDISFEEFALSCARAFGACVEMRDDPGDAKIPEEFTPSPYYKKALDDAYIEKTRLEELSVAECYNEAEVEYIKNLKYYNDTLKISVEINITNYVQI